MNLTCDIYNPYSNNEVTNHYIDTIKSSFETISIKCFSVAKIEKNGANKRKAIFVISPLDVVRAKKAKYKYVFCWLQGIIPEESYMRNHSKIRQLFLSFLEKRGLKNSDFVFFVSETMKEYVKAKYKLPFANYFIMPCFNENFPFDSNSFENKQPLSFVYAGGIEPWQCLEETIHLYSMIETKYPNAKLYLLVRDADTANLLARRYAIKNFSVGFYPKNELNKLLSSIEFGFCLRNNSIVNNVSTPTKLSTYICNGIRPIYSSSIKSFAQIARQSKYTVELDLKDLKEAIAKVDFGEKYSKNCIFDDFKKVFGTYYSDTRYIKEIADSVKRFLIVDENDMQ